MSRPRSRLLIVTIVAMAMSAIMSATPAEGVSRASKPAVPRMPIVQAHRGGSPPNSLSALRSSIGLGVGELEIDVRRTSDGVLVLHHDAATGNACDTPGVGIAETPWPALSTIRCWGEPIPRFDSALSLVKKAKQSLMVDIKRAPGETDDSLADLTRQVVAALKRYKLVERTRLSSAEWTVVAPVAHRAMRTIRVAAGEVAPSLKRIKLAASLGIVEYSIPASRADLFLVRFPRRYSMGVTLWGIDNDQRLRYAVDAGSRYITTDTPAATIGLLRSTNVSRLLANRRVTTTKRPPQTVLSATLTPNSRQYPVVLGDAVPMAARERLVDVRLAVVVTGADKKGVLRIGGPNMANRDDVVLKLPKGSASFTVSQSIGDNNQLRIYTTDATATVTVQVVGWRTLTF
ncbi:MAG: glycerophosphodiester phosphodiesterase [Micropruina sp.]|uniref:glycerophosphodiester phosphodiesterase n=1 Tax=Micropruina sp. TaxID=2737536 RepID=UPI0039E56C1C